MDHTVLPAINTMPAFYLNADKLLTACLGTALNN